MPVRKPHPIVIVARRTTEVILRAFTTLLIVVIKINLRFADWTL